MADRLKRGKRMRPEKPLWSKNGKYKFLLQHDGNLVLYRCSRDRERPIWDSVTSDAEFAVLQDDGNFVLYRDEGHENAIWHSDTCGQDVDYLIVQNDGNVVIYDGSRPVWATNTMQVITTWRATERFKCRNTDWEEGEGTGSSEGDAIDDLRAYEERACRILGSGVADRSGLKTCKDERLDD